MLESPNFTNVKNNIVTPSIAVSKKLGLCLSDSLDAFKSTALSYLTVS